MEQALAIKSLRALDEMRAAVDLQKTFWGEEVESVVPAHMLFSIANHGGHVLAAFDGARMVGVLIGFLGTSEENQSRPAMANLQIVSKRMVVLPEYRNHGVGFRLKLAQREKAIEQGIRLVTWTFDPLLAPNAHLNVRKLGVTCSTYLQDYYGTGAESGLSTLGSSDRLLAEWWVTNRRVEVRLSGSRTDLTLAHYLEADTPIVNPTTATDDGVLLPSEQVKMPAGSLALLEIPLNYTSLVQNNPTLGQLWRTRTRTVFNHLMNESGYVITDFLRETYEGRERAFYLLTYSGKPVFDSPYVSNPN